MEKAVTFLRNISKENGAKNKQVFFALRPPFLPPSSTDVRHATLSRIGRAREQSWREATRGELLFFAVGYLHLLVAQSRACALDSVFFFSKKEKEKGRTPPRKKKK